VVVILTAVWLAMVGFAGLHFVSAFRSAFHLGLSSCLPADFPHYPRASLASVVISDSQGDCTIQYQTRDSAAEVRSFYKTNLNEGDWMVTVVNDPAGVIRFRRLSRPDTSGYVQVISFPGSQTQFQIQIRGR
jgi:hypothetical protein